MPISPDYRIIKKGKEAREKLKKGVDEVVDVVKITLGPYGRNCVIDASEQRAVPHTTNDGVSIAKEVSLQDEIENLGALSIIEAATKTNKQVGDGTTTTLVLSQAILNEIYSRIKKEDGLTGGVEGIVSSKSKFNLMDFKRQIEKSAIAVLEKLGKQAKPLQGDDLVNVATTSVEDEELGKIIAEMMQAIGKDGFISVDDTFQEKTETEVVSGMRFHGKVAGEFMRTHKERKESIFIDPLMLITNYQIENRNQIISIIDMLKKSGRSEAVIFADSFTLDVLKDMYVSIFQFIQSNGRNGFKLLAVKTPSLLPGELEDIAYYTGGTFIDKEKGMEIEKATLNELGKAQKIICSGENDVMIVKGKGADVEKRIKELKEQLKNETLEEYQNKYRRRIASLSGGVGIIKVGAKTDVEKYYKKDKIDDAVWAVRAAMEEGVVKGGGLALKEIADGLKESDVLKEPLKSPYQQIIENAGGQLTEKDLAKVLDPAKVVRIALENAVSFAATFITTESAIAWKRFDVNQKLLKVFENMQK